MVATIKDVATAAGVSFKTVSRFINGETNIRPAYRERIEAAIRELNYQPTLAARQLASQKSFIISLVVADVLFSYNARMMLAIAAECRRVGYHLMTEVLGGEFLQGPNTNRINLSARPDCVILIPPFPDDVNLLRQLEEQGLPVVRIAAIGDGYGTTIRIDDEPVTMELMQHFFDMGHRRIAMIAPPLPERASESRVRGYRRALEEAGIAFDPALLVRCPFSLATAVDATTELLALPDRPTAIFAASDTMALGAMARAHQLGYRVPDDVAIAGFDDAPESRYSFPPITTIRQPIEDMARAAVVAATKRGGPAPEIRQRLKLRGSTTGDRMICRETNFA
ncbi:MAG: LacI family DNA-binding transcriptional regulator [Novosphingobium sp.]|uniref:LacI family DNA-binding transcriptional regulator n=1 Tax=Novosphingobium sp. TaxID=1874826 RepID=UPI003B9D6DBB